MTEIAFLTKVCIECLEGLNGDTYRKDYLDNPLCQSCVENYYAACAECLRVVAVDEATIVNAGCDGVVYHCPNCKSSTTSQVEVSYDMAEVARLVDEYVGLHAEERRVKEQMEAVKQKLKEIAEAQSDGKKPVTLAGSDGISGVKCTYRTSLKADAEKVAELQDCLGQELFAMLFSEKLSFDVNKSNFEKLVSADAELPEDVRRQIEAAVKISVSATLNVA